MNVSPGSDPQGDFPGKALCHRYGGVIGLPRTLLIYTMNDSEIGAFFA